ncbi:MAG: dipeptidase [Candidatus Thorarchaeota archaeon]
MPNRGYTREEYLKLSEEEKYIKLTPSESERAEELFKKSLKVDLHTHIFGSVIFEWNEEKLNFTHQMGVEGCFEAVPSISENFAESMDLLGKYITITEKEPSLIPAYKAADIKKAKKEGKQAVIFQLEPNTFGRNLERVEIAYGLGIRMALLAFNTRNYIGDGIAERTNAGLSYLGLELVERMNKIGMLIDLSHCGIQTSLDAIEHSKEPCVFNHAGARVLNPPCKRLRNDEELQAVAEKKGLIGISGIPNQLSFEFDQGIEDHLKHIKHCVDLVGIDHVAIGLDNVFRDQVAGHRRMAASRNFEKAGIQLKGDYLFGLEGPHEWKNIVRGLVAEGYSDEEIQKIIGGNAMKIIERVIG